MNVNEIIKYPILTEKSYALMPKDTYIFAVNINTNRTEVKKAIELIFQVKVSKVNIINVDKKPTKLGKSKGFTNKIKKAIIVLKEGKINIYPDEVKADKSKNTNDLQNQNKDVSLLDKNKQIDNKMSDAEKKAAAKIASGLKKQEEKQEIKKVQVKENKVENKIEKKIESKIENKVENKIEKKIESKIENKVEKKIESKTEKKVEKK